MMATVPQVTSGLGLRKFQVDGFLLTRVYNTFVSTGQLGTLLLCTAFMPQATIKCTKSRANASNH